ncbi:MAG: LPXTG cell wall anchor domain-containing protein [Cellulomonas iranensis]|uniref:LPXTG cell wall anchor domain-containing protein n=1 Tax=Cellulomonas iranensis TaxID=76862 RepID=UPI001B02CAAA|nr:LPXTG cell wall anchor domain-containing protein [Cellulomonas iranensis]MBO9569811.1 LPXTG cell wall anchor domain-containing protein [Cellulomonas iranensis]
MSRRRTALLTAPAAAAAAALTLVGAATSASAGSDAPTPYRVTPSGLELPAGDVFEVHGHVNVVYTTAAGRASRNVHVEGPGTPYADLAGTSTLTWDRAGLPADACVTWVQVAGYDEHHGEGGQAPVCRTAVAPPPVAPPVTPPSTPAPPPTVTPPPATTPPPAAPTPVSSTPVAPSGPARTPAGEVDQAPAPAPTADVEVVAETPTPGTSAPATTPAPTATERSEVLSAGADDATPTARAQVGAATQERSEALAATGTRTGALLAAGALALGLGGGLVTWRRRRAAGA